MRSRTATVAVSAFATGTSPAPGVAIARSLREAPGFAGRIVALAYDALESGLYVDGLADSAFVVPYPSAGTDSFLDRLTYVAERVGVDVAIPTLDAELPAYIRLSDRLAERGIRTFLPTEAQLRARAKSDLEALGRSIEVDVPVYRLAADLDAVGAALRDLGPPVMVKGVFYEAVKASTPEEARAAGAAISARWGFPLIVQSIVRGDEYNLAMVGDGAGGVVGAVALRKTVLTDKGKAFGGITVRDEDLDGIALRFASATRWRGPLELEFVRGDRDGRFHLIEVNPRFPAWIYLATGAGLNLPWAVVRLALGEKVAPMPPCPPGVFFVRHAVDVVSRLDRLEALQVSGEYHRPEVPER